MIPIEQLSNLKVVDLPARASEVNDGIQLLGGQSTLFRCINRAGTQCGRFSINRSRDQITQAQLNAACNRDRPRCCQSRCTALP